MSEALESRLDPQPILADSLLARTAEADALRVTNRGLRESRMATLNLMQDAVTARQQAEQGNARLLARETLLRLATDAADLGIWTWQLDGDRITWENDWPYDVMGMAPGDMPLTTARFAADFVHTADLPAFRQAMAKTVRTGARLFYQGRFHCPDGKLRWIEFTGQPVPGPDGLRVIGTVRDINERKLAEESLAKSQAMLSLAVQAGQLGIWDWDLVANTVVWDQRCKAMAGLPPDLDMSQALALSTVHPGDSARMEAEIARALAARVDSEVEYRTLWPDGSVHWLQSRGRSVADASGRLVRFTGITQDITKRKHAEAVLRESEERLLALVTASTDMTYSMSPDWSEIRQLDGKKFITDVPATGGNWIEQLLLPEDRPRVMGAISDAIRTRTIFSLEHRIIRVDGSLGWTLSRAVPLLDASGDIVEWFGSASDVTEDKRAEQALHESEERYRTLFNSIDEGFCLIDMVFDKDDKSIDYRFLEVNPAFELQTGQHDVVGRRMREIAPDIEAHWFEVFGKVALTGEPIRFVSEANALDGRWFDVNAFRLGGPQSRKVAIIFNNITERKKSEEALRLSEERLRLAAEAAHFGMYDRDLQGAYFHTSGRLKQLLGYAPDAPLEHAQAMSHIHPDDRPAGVAAFQRACDPLGDGRIAVEQRIVRRDGVERWFVTVGQVLFEDGAPTRSIGFWVDINERKSAELALRAANTRLEHRVKERTQALQDKAHQLERASRVKSEFLASMSHELRTPLNGIIGFTEFLHDEKPGPLLPKQKEYLNDVLDSARHLLELINEVLDIAKVEAGKIDMRPSSFSVAQAIEEARTVIQGGADKKGIGVRVAVEGGLEAVVLDPLRFKQVLHNLLSNAVKFSGEGGRVEIHARRLAADELELRVCDSGIGIKEADLGLLFTEFGQLDSGAGRRTEGTGLGLALTKKLVELQGGRIDVRSVVGEGSVFTVVLPLPADVGRP